MDIIKLIEEDSKLTFKEQVNGEDVSKERKQLEDTYSKQPATLMDVDKAAIYIINAFMNATEPMYVANKARYDLLVRALEKNRVLSKDVLESVKQQLEAINSEEKKEVK